MSAANALSDAFKTALLSGPLQPILNALQTDDTLLIGLRQGYISIYYRGGELLKITGRGNAGFEVSFNPAYDTAGNLPARLQRHGDATILLRPVTTAADAEALVEIFGELKGLMDRHDKIRYGHEREFQQLMARVNNRTRSSNSSHYFVTDIEHAEGRARFDMLGVRWRHDEHRHGNRLVPVIFEVKYGESALQGSASLVKHLEDALAYAADDEHHATLCRNVATQFNQLSDLDLLKFQRAKSISEFSVVKNHIQIVFVLAEYTPHSVHLANIVDALDALMEKFAPIFNERDVKVDLLFAGASLCGYAMHEVTMLKTDQVKALLRAWQPA